MRKRLLWLLAVFFIGVLCCTYITLVAHRKALPRVILGKETSEVVTARLQAMGFVKQEAEDRFSVDFNIPIQWHLLQIGEKFNITIPSDHNRMIPGTVIYNNQMAENRELRLEFQDNSLRGGEQAVLYYQYISNVNYLMVPSSAVHRDEQGEYILTVMRHESVFGYTYSLTRSMVTVWFDTGEKSYLFERLGVSLPFVISSDQPVSIGDEVRIYP